MASTNPARGMRDFLPADVRKREYVIGIIKEVYESYGFEPLETPAVENLDTLMGKYGDEGNQLIYKILKRGEKLTESLDSENPQSAIRNPQSLSDLALRYDLTVPLARVVANHKNDVPKFFKRYQIQPVWRADRPARGRFREFYQCDVDAIGSCSMVVEAELVSAVGEILIKLGFEKFQILANHRDVLTSILAAAGVEESKYADALVALDKRDKIGNKGVADEFAQRGIAKKSCDEVLGLFSRIDEFAVNTFDLAPDCIEFWSPEEFDSWNAFTIAQLRVLFENNEAGQAALDELIQFLELNASGSGSGKVLLFPSLARGLSYYTGTIMEIVVPDLAGSLGGGGRYDGLIGMFGKEQIPACGFSLGLERILVVMEERGMFPPEIAESTPADVLVTIWNEETVGESLKLANELRSNGIRVTLYPEPDKLGKQVKYADSVKVPFVCVLGESELAEGKVTLKNMRTGEQQTLERKAIADALKK